jgi:hypothetical protein
MRATYPLEVYAPTATEDEVVDLAQAISDHIMAVANDFHRRTGKEIAITFDASRQPAKV